MKELFYEPSNNLWIAIFIYTEMEVGGDAPHLYSFVRHVRRKHAK